MRRPIEMGFTLIELILVMTLLTLLITIALPNFTLFTIRSGRAEMRTQLSALAQAEFTFYGENNAFTDDLRRVDWSIQGNPRYLYGFTSDVSGSANNDTAEARANGFGDFSTHKMVDSFGILLTESDLPPAVLAEETFTIGAAGNFDWDAALDRWTVNRSGTFINVTDEMEL